MSEPPVANPEIASILGTLDKIEARISKFQSAIDDDRVPGLAAIVRSARLLVEISQFNSLMAADLMPAASAALLHARTVMNQICVEFTSGKSIDDDQTALLPENTPPPEQSS